MQHSTIAFLCLTIMVFECLPPVRMQLCSPNYCDKVDCATRSNAPPCTGDQVFYERGSPCGCCDACISPLYEGDFCNFEGLYDAPVQHLHCAEGLGLF